MNYDIDIVVFLQACFSALSSLNQNYAVFRVSGDGVEVVHLGVWTSVCQKSIGGYLQSCHLQSNADASIMELYYETAKPDL